MHTLEQTSADQKFNSEFGSFLKRSAAIFGWVYYELLVFFAPLASFDLTSFPGHLIGPATMTGTDVQKRIRYFYGAFALLFVWQVAGFLLHRKYYERLKRHFATEINLLNQLALVGLFFATCRLSVAAVPREETLLEIFMLLVCAGGCLRKWLAPALSGALARRLYLSVGTLALALLHPITWALYATSYEAEAPHAEFVWATLCATALSFALLVLPWLRKSSARLGRRVAHSLHCAKPLALAPALYIVSAEIFFLLNEHQIFSVSLSRIYSAFLGVLIVTLIYRHVRLTRQAPPSIGRQLASFYFPWLVAGFTALFVYRPTLSVNSSSMYAFEYANTALAVQRFYLFKEWPILHTYSSHFLSDYLLSFIYTLVHGYRGLEFGIFTDLITAFYALAAYFVARFLTLSSGFAFLFALAVPNDVLFNSYFSLTVFPFLALTQALKRNQTKVWFTFFAVTAFTLLWRLDLGVAHVGATLATGLALYGGQSGRNWNWRPFAKALGRIAALGVGLLALVALYDGHALLQSLRSHFYYLFRSNQSFGWSVLGSEGKLYNWEYFGFPLLMTAAFACAMGLCFGQDVFRRRRGRWTLAFFYFAGFYLANLQRGLVRHSLAEGAIVTVRSFVFFAFALLGLVLLRFKRSTSANALYFAGVLSIIALEYGSQVPLGEAYLNTNFRTLFADRAAAPIERVRGKVAGSEARGAGVGDFKEFLDKNFRPEETFLDFSNQPMLYYYTARRVPNGFNQALYSSKYDRLQDMLIEGLSKYSVPVVVFSASPPALSALQPDMDMDLVPNFIAHYRIAEFILANYQPLYKISQRSIWIRNDEKRPALLPQTLYEGDAGHLAAQWAKTSFDAHRFHAVFLEFQEPQIPPVRLGGAGDPVSLGPKRQVVLFAPGQTPPKNISVALATLRHLKRTRVVSFPFEPDFSWLQPMRVNLQKLPSVWASEPAAPNKQILVTITTPTPLSVLKGAGFKVEESLDRSTGNFLNLHVMNYGDSTAQISVNLMMDDGEVAGSFLMTVPQTGQSTLKLRLSSLPAWWIRKPKTFLIQGYQLNGDVQILLAEIEKG